jgi:hypothetical protein
MVVLTIAKCVRRDALMAKAKTAPLLKYGAYWDASADPLEIEFECIRRGGKWTFRDRTCGKGLPHHVKAAARLMWPKRYWHEWSDLICSTFLNGPGRTGCFGPSSSQKSFHFTMCSLVMFYARPNGTTVLISSTTKDDLQRRIWAYVLELDKEAREIYPDLPGHFIESELKLLADAKDVEGRSRKNGVMGVACKKGGQWQGLEGYVGTKNDVLLLVCDECQFMPVGFLDSLANLESNDPCYAAMMGNLPDVENPLGWACEPKNGWESLPDTKVSRTYETKWVNGRAIQLIGLDSPNLKFPEGQEPFKGLIGRRYIDQCRVNYGEDSTKFNMFASGLVPKAGMHCTVFTKQECIKHNATAPVMWGHEPVTRGYGLDAAYSGLGGDRTVGFPFIFGRDVTNRWRFWLGPMHVYPGSNDPKVTHAEAIALECKRQCEAAGIAPDHVFFDGTGRSELTSAFARLWSSDVVPIEFGGPATTRPSFTGEVWRMDERSGKSAGTVKACSEVFDRFVTELWFALKWCIVADQMRGMPQEAIDEGSLRKFELVRGGRESIETKDEMKERGLRSPDIVDAVVCALEGARRLGFPLGRHTTPEKRKDSNLWFKQLKEQERQRAREAVLTA